MSLEKNMKLKKKIGNENRNTIELYLLGLEPKPSFDSRLRPQSPNDGLVLAGAQKGSARSDITHVTWVLCAAKLLELRPRPRECFAGCHQVRVVATKGCRDCVGLYDGVLLACRMINTSLRSGY